MPLVRQWTVFDDCEILVWQIGESPEKLLKELIVTAEEWEEFKTISHPQKQLEWLTGRRAMQVLVESTGGCYKGMLKDEYGKPHLKHRIAEVSLTHTLRYVGVTLHPVKSLGIDMERMADKLARVAPKFLSEEEKEHAQMELSKLVTYWCAKEALYKLHGTRQLSFKDHIAVEAFQDTDAYVQGSIGFNDLPRQFHQLHRFWVEDFCGVVAV
ncbi:4'-phosphopantetheinyl transferase family protein [Runella slithyformis]|uniref:4'-phosphopantetheinyl transferase n=1 Tax=Runella slithyformis (strain ATCC 29530 / DSM 19594 / LMG 11500 / NCIMB 11436 / LSU 4) TaxID=761193 RepID=A0A7U3ZK94_RUNSL|nr:4'-phosphopantetheinyl transferase family protein [Runella slithyformis]AEI48777.1 4'-phosphopantetheinyl transferase [Runella slithyformis DSM 19594]